MSDYGLLQEVRIVQRGSVLTDAAAVDDTQLVVEYAGDFNYDPDDPDDSGGTLDLNGVRLGYSSIIFGELPDDPDTIVLTDPVTVAADPDDFVGAVGGGQILEDWEAFVTMGAGDQVVARLTIDQRSQWPVGVYDDPVPVVLSDDLRHIEDAPGRTVTLRATIWAEDHTTAPTDDADAPLTLSHTPVPNTLAVFKNGLRLRSSEFTFDGLLVTVLHGAEVVIRADDEVSAYYEYDDAAEAIIVPPEPPTFLDLMTSLGPLWWARMDETLIGQGIVDYSGNGRSPSPGYTSPTLGAAGLVAGDTDTAVAFNGATTHGTLTDAAWMDSAVGGLILFKTSTSGVQTLMARVDSTASSLWALQLNGGNLRFALGNPSVGGTTFITSSGLSLNDGAKHMAAWTFDGTTLWLYTEAGEVASAAASLATGTAALTLGGHQGGGGGSYLQLLNGTLDEAALFGPTPPVADDFAEIWEAVS